MENTDFDERYGLAAGRVSEIAAGAETKGMSSSFVDYFRRTAEFLDMMTKETEFIKNGGLLSAGADTLRIRNHAIYNDILPENYGNSFANPTYAESELGSEYGPLLSTLYYEMRSVIPFIYDSQVIEDAMERVLTRYELFLEIYGVFETADEGTLPPASEIKHRMYDYLSDYIEDELAYDTREKLISDRNLAGIVIKDAEEATADRPARPRRAFDMFRNRAIFPIIDQYGNVLAFGGRAIENVQPKYLNTSDTPIFNKRLGVYAANLLRKERHLERVVLVEGYMDVVSLTQFGVTGVCATLGTALTNEQAKLLKRFAPMVYLSYDGDSAGQHAILRGLDILEAEGIPARVLDFPDGLDPDEFIRRDGKEGFDKLPALTPQAYRMRRLRAEHDLTTQEGRTAYAKACAAILRNLEPVEMENALQELIVQTGFSRDVLIAQIGMTPPKDITSAPPLPARIARPPATPVPEPENADEDVRAEELLLSLIASSRLPEDLAQEDDFRDPLLKELFLQLQSGVSAASLVESQSDEVVRARVSHLLMAQSGESTDQMLQMAHDCLSRMRLKRARAQYDEIMKRIKTLSGAEKMQALDEAKQLTATINRLK